MRVLVTGHDGYIGRVLVPHLETAGHEVVGLDSFLFDGCTLGPETPAVASISADIRDVGPGVFAGFDAVVHLAGISNDPLGDLRPETTFDINHLGAVHVARMAKLAGVQRFVFSSSCSLYGAQGDGYIDEDAPFNPVTPYGRSKVLAEERIGTLADDDFAPIFLRNGTAYGVSTRLRGDLVVNNLMGYAVATGQVLLKSDGAAWRPLVHIEDISLAVRCVLECEVDLVHNEAFNVGRTAENYQVREVADIVAACVPGSVVKTASGAGADKRNYRVDCSRLPSVLPEFQPRWTVPEGVQELRDAYLRHGLTVDDLTGARFGRIRHVQEMQAGGLIDTSLRWVDESISPNREVLRHA